MARIPRAIYTRELREEAVKLVTEGGLSIPEVGRRLSIATSTIRYWVKASREGKLQDVGRQQRPLTEVEMELARVKRELAQVKIEREIFGDLERQGGQCGGGTASSVSSSQVQRGCAPWRVHGWDGKGHVAHPREEVGNDCPHRQSGTVFG
jgi:transposase